MTEGSVFQRADGRWVAMYKDARATWRYIYRKSRGEASVCGFTFGWSAGFYTLWAPVADRQEAPA